MNKLEIIGALFGIAGVWLTVKEKVWCFPVGIINVIITAYLVFIQKLYADCIQQLVYFILLIIGWINWSDIKISGGVKTGFLTQQQRLIYVPVLIGSAAILYLILKNYTDAALPFWDSAGTTICFIAQYLIAKKKIENWLLWMIANVMYIGIYYVKGMEYYSLLSLAYLAQAIFGWNLWRLSIDKNINK